MTTNKIHDLRSAIDYLKTIRMKDICCIGHVTKDKIVTPSSTVYMASKHSSPSTTKGMGTT